jgi:hypothetical protein
MRIVGPGKLAGEKTVKPLRDKKRKSKQKPPLGMHRAAAKDYSKRKM